MLDRENSSNAARSRLIATLPVRERHLDLAGVETVVLEGGEGSPVVLLHGPAAHAVHWMRIIPRLAATRRVIAPDLPAHGASGTFAGELDVRGMMAWLAELIERTCATPPVLVGHLMGGAIAARFAAEQSRRLRRLVLIDTFGLTEFSPVPEFGAAVGQFFAAPNPSSHKALWDHCAHDLERLKRRMAEVWQDFEEYNVASAGTAGLRDSLPTFMTLFAQHSLDPELLANIAVPTTLVWGRHDRATPLSVAEAASKRYGWPLRVIEDVNDDPPIEQPEALVSLLGELLSGDP